MAEINVSISGQLWNLGLTYVPQCEPGPRIEVWHLEHWGGAVFLNEQFLTHFCNDNSSLRPIPMDTNNLYVNERRFILQGKHWGRLQFWSLQTTGFYPLQNSWCKTASLPARLLLLKCRMPLSFLNTHPKPAILPFSAVNKCTTEADNTYRRPRFACDARNALLPLMAHGPWVSWDPWSSSCPIGSLSTFWTQFSSFSWL